MTSSGMRATGAVQGRMNAQLKTPRRCCNTSGATDNCKELIGMSKHTSPNARNRSTSANHGGWDSWESRLRAGYEVTPSGCWEWQRSRNSRGYGVIYFDKKLHLAHRASFYLANGRWPERGMVTDHACENKGCVNPAHLRELSNRANIRRAVPEYGKYTGGDSNRLV